MDRLRVGELKTLLALVSLYNDETLDMVTDLIDGEVRFFGLASPGPDLKGCELHRRLLAEYGKAHAEAL